jgi:HEAT repeat protein
MRKGLRIAPLILLGIVLVGLALYCVWPRERSYQGRPLSQWLEEYRQVLNNTNREQQRKDQERFAAVDPAIVPDLVNVLEKQAGLNFEDKLGNQLFQFSATRSIGRRLGYRVTEAQNRRLVANYLLGLLGPKAEPAIPAMLRMYQNTNDPEWVRSSIPWSLARINRRPDLVVPVLAESLSGPQFTQTAAYALAEFGTNSISAIPALLKALHQPDMLNALAAAQTIHMIDPKASLAAEDEVMPLLLKALESPVRMNWGGAIHLLAQYGDRAKAAVPTLLRLLDDEDARIRFFVTNSLPRIDPEAAAKAGVQ